MGHVDTFLASELSTLRSWTSDFGNGGHTGTINPASHVPAEMVSRPSVIDTILANVAVQAGAELRKPRDHKFFHVLVLLLVLFPDGVAVELDHPAHFHVILNGQCFGSTSILRDSKFGKRVKEYGMRLSDIVTGDGTASRTL